ncbi:MAG TPA: hypothetical protein VEG32_00980 [Clostridia bacterium]|nr:hypothetical protein [Clostridia bacterium]
MTRTRLIAIAGVALGGWLVLFGGRNPSPALVVLSLTVLAVAVWLGSVVSTQIERNAQVQGRKLRLFQLFVMVSWVGVGLWMASALARALGHVTL